MIVIGGGLAGLSAACDLADRGFAVSLVDRRSVLGGRATSLRIRGVPEPVDNCQHVLMRSCSALLDFYTRLGVREHVRFDQRISFIDRRGGVSSLGACALPAPLHLAPSFARLRFLGVRDKLAIARALAAVRSGTADAPEEPFSRWLWRHGQPARALDAFWRPVLASALNEDPEHLDTGYALLFLRETFLARRDGWELGVPMRPLAEMHSQPAAAYLTAREARVLYRAAASRLLVDDDAVIGVRLADGRLLRADYYVSAVPYHVLPRLLPPELAAEPPFSLPQGLRPSPILSVHLWLDRPVTPLPHAALIGRSVHWLFNKTLDFGIGGGCEGEGPQPPHTPPTLGGYGGAEEAPCHLALVTSAARALMHLPREEVLRLVVEEIRGALPETRKARVVRALVIKEKHATFSPLPGCDRLRPAAETPLRNLFLAGDWTDTGWPATMEGAVRSGVAAARRLASAAGVSGERGTHVADYGSPAGVTPARSR